MGTPVFHRLPFSRSPCPTGLDLRVLSLERRPNRANPTGQINNWSKILNVFAITYGDRLTIN